MRGLSLTLVLSLSMGCAIKVSSEGGSETLESSAAPDRIESEPEAVAPVELEQPPPTDPHAQLPDCPAEASEDVYCTEAGKLAGRWMMVDRLRVPEGAEEIFAAVPQVERQPSLRIAVEGETLYIRKVSCGSCARVMGEGFMGQLDAMSEAQLLELAARLGLSEDVAPLATAQAWRDFAAGAGSEVLESHAGAEL